MGCNHLGSNQVNRLVWFFFTQKIGEYAYGFSFDEEEEINGDSLTIYGSTIIADAADFIKVYTQYTLDDYLFNLSIAKIQFMAVDNTHTKYLKGRDKKAWTNYKEALESQRKLDGFFGNFNIPELEEGEEFEIPVHKNKKKQENKEEDKTN